MEQRLSVQLLDSMPILDLGGWPPPHSLNPLASQVGFRRQPTVDIWHPIPPGTSPPAERALEGTSAWALPLVHCTQAYTHTRARRNTLKHACTHARDQSLQTDAQAGGHPDPHPHKHARTHNTHTHNHAKMHTLPSPQRQKQAKPQTHMRTHKHTRTTHTQTQRRLMWPTRTHVHPHGASHISTHIAHYTQASRHTGTQVGAHPIPGSGWVEPACS